MIIIDGISSQNLPFVFHFVNPAKMQCSQRELRINVGKARKYLFAITLQSYLPGMSTESF